jgi:hypothetical protein
MQSSCMQFQYMFHGLDTLNFNHATITMAGPCCAVVLDTIHTNAARARRPGPLLPNQEDWFFLEKGPVFPDLLNCIPTLLPVNDLACG